MERNDLREDGKVDLLEAYGLDEDEEVPVAEVPEALAPEQEKVQTQVKPAVLFKGEKQIASPNALGKGIAWDTCDKAVQITMQVDFVSSATWVATIFGKAVQ